MTRPSCSSSLSVSEISLSLNGTEGVRKVKSACKREHVNSTQFMSSFKQCREKLTWKAFTEAGGYTIHSNTKYAAGVQLCIRIYYTACVQLAHQSVHMCAYAYLPLKHHLFSCVSACVCVRGPLKGMDGQLSKPKQKGRSHNLTLGLLGTLPPQWGQPHTQSGQSHPKWEERTASFLILVPPPLPPPPPTQLVEQTQKP